MIKIELSLDDLMEWTDMDKETVNQIRDTLSDYIMEQCQSDGIPTSLVNYDRTVDAAQIVLVVEFDEVDKETLGDKKFHDQF